MSKKLIDDLQTTVARLQAERQSYVDAVAAIDGTFRALGITPSTKKTGRGAAAKKVAFTAVKKRGKRRKFNMTASELIATTIKKAGAKGATGAQISKAWKAAGRPGDAYNTLTVLCKEKKIKRQKIKGGRGSMYTLP